MKGKNKVCSLFLLVVLLLFSGSCGKAPEEKTEITLLHGWGTTEPDHVCMRQIYSDFEKQNPDVRLNLVSMPSSEEVIIKANDMLSVGKVPDIIFTGGIGRDSFYRFMVRKGYAVDFSAWLSEDAAFAEDISPLNRQYWENDDGSIYTVSDVLLYGGGYWYNEDIFKKAGIHRLPSSFADWKEACRRIAIWAQEEQEIVVPIQLNGENALYLTDLLLLDAGGESGKGMKEHEVTIVQEEFSDILVQLTELNGYAEETKNDIGYRDVLKDFNEGKTTMYLNGVWAGAMIDGGKCSAGGSGGIEG
ncbi:ABC transporter substrate-binding protein [Eisenbergiella porci]|uniref:ABC transporter substrate-binding protein n=1 Tax=Eisenbergiella porci TaxID=2652274 RepID=UPI002A812272|nr:ABC transporter substrate-binding protein [Eisenbergiella porci]